MMLHAHTRLASRGLRMECLGCDIEDVSGGNGIDMENGMKRRAYDGSWSVYLSVLSIRSMQNKNLGIVMNRIISTSTTGHPSCSKRNRTTPTTRLSSALFPPFLLILILPSPLFPRLPPSPSPPLLHYLSPSLLPLPPPPPSSPSPTKSPPPDSPARSQSQTDPDPAH